MTRSSSRSHAVLSRPVAALLVALVLIGVPAAQTVDKRTQLRPGWNLLSPKQDIEIGALNSKEAEKQLVMLHDARVDTYLNNLGHKLAGHAPGEKYPYQYKCVNTRDLNAFAMPGGYIYINRGIIENADNEAQLAAVMGHETSHVALRHGTNQASKAYLAQMPLALLGGVLGDNAVGALLTQIGGFALNSVLLKYSRTAESQADILGTQIIYDNGYDPRAMAQFFEKLGAVEKQNGAPAEFFSNHPSPEHRIERVTEEVDKLGGPPKNYKSDSAEFRDIKRYVLSLPPPPKAAPPTGGESTPAGGQRPEPPSSGQQSFQNNVISLSYPDNWHSAGQGDAATLAPQGGVVDDGKGNGALAWGMIINIYEPRPDQSGKISLEDATNQLLEDLHQSNPNVRILRRAEPMKLGGQPALSVYLTNDSAIGGREEIWLVTSLQSEGLVHLICVAPQSDFAAYTNAFEATVRSVRFRN
jgi:hypothetical protein